jgi:hypothetical protein
MRAGLKVAAGRAAPQSEYEQALRHLLGWVEARDHTGFDPYDGLNFPGARAVRRHPLANAVVTQTFKRLPVNLRPLLGMPRTRMPKAIGLFLTAYALLGGRARDRRDEAGAAECIDRCNDLVDWLAENTVPGYAGSAWNFGFSYKSFDAHPTVVITAIIARGLFACHALTGSREAARLLRGACDFVLNELHVTETDHGICFSYTPRSDLSRPAKLDCCYNASLLGAEVLAMGHVLTGEPRMREMTIRAADFVVSHQKPDGRWNYSIDPRSGEERKQVDFHQGFIIDSLLACVRHGNLGDPRYLDAIERAARFYRREQFTDDGRALWRLPDAWPADIHCQAQGIITFADLARFDPKKHGEFATTIARWTIRNMQDRQGFFHHRKGRVLTNRIAYMRWGQAWMAVALARLLSGKAGLS